jgi:regulator of RNase E activity RraA
MAAEGFSEEVLSKLLSVSTATLTTVLFKRGLRNTFIGGLQPLNPAHCRMAGPAFTIRFIPSREDIDHVGSFADRANIQRRAIEECPAGHVLVIDSRKDRGAASGGDILLARLMKRGVAGVVTDGGFRDSPDIAKLAFPAYHRGPSAPTILVRHHPCDLNVPIGCGDVPVYPGDIVAGDGEGVVVIPRHLADEVAAEAAEQTLFEEYVQERVMAGETIFGLYPPGPEAKDAFQKWRAAREKP